MTIKTFDKATLRTMREDINAALAPLAARHGITLQAAGISFTAITFSVKLEGAIPEAKASQDDAVLRTMAAQRGLDPDKVSADGFKLVAFDRNRPVRPWIAERGGKQYLLKNEDAKLRFAATA